MSELDIRSLEVFLAVADAGGMTAAAQQLGMSQSAVSQKLANLEAALNVMLVDRSMRPVALSVAGELLYDRAKQILAALYEAERLVRETSNTALPQLRLALVDSAAATIGPALVGYLQDAAHTIQVRSGLGPSHAEDLLAREVDLILTPEHDMEERTDFRQAPVLTEPFVLVVPADYTGPVDSLQGLSETLELVRYTRRSMIGQQVERHLRRIRLSPKRHLEFDTTDVVIAMVGGGVGWALTTPLCLLQSRARLGSVRCLPVPKPGFTRTLTLIGRQSELGPVFDQVVRACRDALHQHCLPEIARILPGFDERIVITPER